MKGQKVERDLSHDIVGGCRVSRKHRVKNCGRVRCGIENTPCICHRDISHFLLLAQNSSYSRPG
eukprot:scaffold4204_cov140-Cylindrotheca_fusiformis.AAC.12